MPNARKRALRFPPARLPQPCVYVAGTYGVTNRETRTGKLSRPSRERTDGGTHFECMNIAALWWFQFRHSFTVEANATQRFLAAVEVSGSSYDCKKLSQSIFFRNRLIEAWAPFSYQLAVCLEGRGGGRAVEVVTILIGRVMSRSLTGSISNR